MWEGVTDELRGRDGAPFSATLERHDGQALTLDRTTASGRDYAVAAYSVFR